jgi:uncharacterized membrane protein
MKLSRQIARIALGTVLLFAGIGHLTFARATFQAQVPPWLPLAPDFVVIVSGVVELGLGIALIAIKSGRVAAGWLTAAFFLAIFPGNVAQFAEHRDAFGLNSDEARFIRLIFQPILILWALWSTGAYQVFKKRYRLSKKGEIK